MGTRRVVKEIRRADHKRRVSIFERDDGLYSFAEDAEGDTYTYDTWPQLAEGAIYESAEHAEREARAQVRWLAQADIEDEK